MSLTWLGSSFPSRGSASDRRRRGQSRRRRIALESLEDRTLLSTYTWSATSPGVWSNAANWTVTNVGTPHAGGPDVHDDVVFDGTSIKDSTIDGAFTVNTVSINTGYSGTISIGSGDSLVARQSGGTAFSQAAGTFNTSGQDFTSYGAFSQTGGTFNAGASNMTFRSHFNRTAGTFNAGTSTATFNGNGNFLGTNTFNNVVLDRASGSTNNRVLNNSSLIVNGNLTLGPATGPAAAGDLNTVGTGSIQVKGNLISNATSIGGDAAITMTSAANASITGGDFPGGGVVISKFSGSVVTANVTTPLRGPLTLVNLSSLVGTFQVAGDVTTSDASVGGNSNGSPVLVFKGDSSQSLYSSPSSSQVPGVQIDKTGGNLLLPGAVVVTGSWLVTPANQGVVTAPIGSLVVFGPYSSPEIDTGSGLGGNVPMSFRNVELASGSASVLTIDVMVVGGELTITNIGNVVGTIEVHGDVTTNDASVGGLGTILFNGTGRQTLSAGFDYASVPSVKVDKSNGSLFVMDPAHLIGVTGSWTFAAGAVQNTNNTVSFRSYSNIVIDTGTDTRMEFFNVEIAKGSGDTLTVPSSHYLSIAGALTITQIGVMNADLGAILVAGDLTSNDSAVGGTADITMVDVDNLTASPATLKGGVFPNGGIKIAKLPFATVTLGSNLSGLKSLNVFLGTLDVGTYTVQVNGPMTVAGGGTLAFTAPAAGGTQLTVNGNLTFASGSTLDVDLTSYSTGTYDLVAVIGAGHSLANGGTVDNLTGGGSLSWTTGPNGKVKVTK